MKKQSNISKKETPLTWETFEDFILTEGLARYKKALEEVDEYTYLKLYPNLLEFIKPKIKRVESTDNSGDPVQVKVLWDEVEPKNTKR
jgi:hypothetical protein